MNIIFLATILGLIWIVGMQEKKPGTQELAACPMHQQHPVTAKEEHSNGVVERGDHVMGFSHDAATHHFRLYADGGAIEVESNAIDDTATQAEIRTHFAHIVKMFAAGDFSAPMLIHAQTPPGVETMKKLRDAIRYQLENTERGARIRITAKNADALAAVHEFLRFQIAEHQTADSTQLTAEPKS